MTDVIIDLTNFKQRVSDRVPEGTYQAIIEDVEAGKARSGAEMITVWWRLLDGEGEGSQIIDRFTLTEAALFRVVALMNVLGFPTPKKRLKVNIARWKGRRALVTVADGEPYRGSVNSEVVDYLKIRAAATEEVTDLDDLATADVPSVPAEAETEPDVGLSADDDAVAEAPAVDENENATIPDTGEAIDLDDIDL